ncbi:hypothetical protein BO70DRAFT_393048 [Aspergillus heteromorphus CBS 117.55]|uniref:Uncharacterized protein n=1 Tax=Aspergillus heteromorphus CBS 117.55 TaxID=1448321 RepID=A0A317WU17_9EURO|nr:uncharacterized protein BO70DRAFT_393048 [Aspergillus heteromorphus CBS 117.55]PWY89846.1 hypothetical protein BO70DRAFT_393048 [Aspergillus heteromorphus CBS 117.55]
MALPLYTNINGCVDLGDNEGYSADGNPCAREEQQTPLEIVSPVTSALKKFGERVISDYKQIIKLFKEFTHGGRILPFRNGKNDAAYQCRIDMGEEIKDKPGYHNVYLQVDSQAKSEGLKDWLRKRPAWEPRNSSDEQKYPRRRAI